MALHHAQLVQKRDRLYSLDVLLFCKLTGTSIVVSLLKKQQNLLDSFYPKFNHQNKLR
ncbi:MAG: hypothetical protein SPJ69_03005 [Campylobacter sp.]|uniref:hypothetical protein n=1 Tax=Campylobacter sp. TaxID=205 RepID=UPI002972F2E3|nr:hypothetical protein [Campylobacter sp.]MDD7600242.1 hypothetical protein [Campylobacteraceae bacterium]MDY5887268.1 hypothetical protein [Campylobacter sp.]